MKVNWLYISIGAVILYFVWKKFSVEEKALAVGKKICECCGNSFLATPHECRKCKRKCKHKMVMSI
jgi:hypothetical protein